MYLNQIPEEFATTILTGKSIRSLQSDVRWQQHHCDKGV